MSQNKGRALPKFGDWDFDDPSSAEGYTMIFNRARDEKKTGGEAVMLSSPSKDLHAYGAPKSSKMWCCFIKATPSRS